MSRGNFSIPKEKQDLWKRFKFSCKRDGCSASSQIVGFMERFLITHEPGNPQTAITSYSPEGQITKTQIEGYKVGAPYNDNTADASLDTAIEAPTDNGTPPVCKYARNRCSDAHL